MKQFKKIVFLSFFIFTKSFIYAMEQPVSCLFASLSENGTAILWNLTEQPDQDPYLETLHGHTDQTTSIAFNPKKPNLIVSTLLGGAISVHNLSKLETEDKYCKILHGHPNTVTTIAFHPQKSYMFFSASLDGTINTWNLTKPRRQELFECRKLNAGIGTFYRIAFKREYPGILFSASDIFPNSAEKDTYLEGPVVGTDGWFKEPLESIPERCNYQDRPRAKISRLKKSIEITADQHIQTTHFVKIWQLSRSKDKECIQTIPYNHYTTIHSFLFHPKTLQIFAPVGFFGSIMRWNPLITEGDGHIIKLPGQRAIALHPIKPNIAASSSTDSTIHLWNLSETEGYRHIKTLNGHNSLVNFIVFHPNKQNIIASASCDGIIIVWDTFKSDKQKGHCNILKGHIEKVKTIVFHPTKSNIIASGAQDGTILIWDTTRPQSFRCIKRLKKHSAAIKTLAFSQPLRKKLKIIQNMRLKREDYENKLAMVMHGQSRGERQLLCKNTLLRPSFGSAITIYTSLLAHN